MHLYDSRCNVMSNVIFLKPPVVSIRTADQVLAEPRYGFTFAASRAETRWKDRRYYDFTSLSHQLAASPVGTKDGACYTPAVFSGISRKQDQATQIDVVVLDSDCGHSLDFIRDAIAAKGWRAIVHSTHSHLTEQTTMAAAAADAWLAEDRGRTIGAYMVAKKGYRPEVAQGAVEVERRELPTGKVDIIVQHRPCPKFRILLLLDRPWVAADYTSQQVANAVWKGRIGALAAALGLSHDQSCVDTSRLFYLPRRRDDGQPFVIETLDGANCDLWSLPAAAPKCGDVCAGGLPLLTTAGRSGGRIDYVDGNGVTFDLKAWAAEYANRFEVVTALRTRTPGIFGARVSRTKHHIACPNSAAHLTNSGDGTGTYCVNASNIPGSGLSDVHGFVIQCVHDGCKRAGHDRLTHLRALLADGSLSVEDLTDPAFLMPELPRVNVAALIVGDAENKDCPQPSLWPEPVDFLGEGDVAGAPQLRRDHLPEALAPFVFDTAERMGAEPAAVALSALVALASVMDDAWAIQPKRHDTSWQEHPRIWGAIIGDPSVMKSPVIAVATAPIDRLETEALNRHIEADKEYQLAFKRWKAAGSDSDTEPTAPVRDRYMVEGTTIEALGEVLRAGGKAQQKAIAGKILIRQDEMAEWIGSFDRYKSGGSGGGDRGAYCRLYNGGRNSVDRIGRGVIDVPNWSACILGGIQPEPIQRMASASADDGLLQRFAYCVATRQPRGVDRAPDAAARLRYESLFSTLAKLHPPRTIMGAVIPIQLSEGAQRHREAMLDLTEAMAVMPDTSNRMKSALDKWRGLVPRMGLIFHLITAADARWRSEEVDLSTLSTEASFQVATNYLREVLLPHLLLADSIMFGSEQTNHAKWIAGFILSKGISQISRRDIIRSYKALKRPEDARTLTEVMASLEAVAWVMPEGTSYPAKAPTSWTVNPKVHEMFKERAKRERTRRDDAKTLIALSAEKRRSAMG